MGFPSVRTGSQEKRVQMCSLCCHLRIVFFHEIISALKIQMVSLSRDTGPWICGTVFIFILMPPFLRQRFQLTSQSFKECAVRVCSEASESLARVLSGSGSARCQGARWESWEDHLGGNLLSQ